MAADAPVIAAMVASPEDLRQVSPLETYPLDRSTVLHWIINRDAGWIIEDQGEIVAYGELVPDQTRSDRFWIGHMIVHPQRRGLGLGQRLVHALIAVAQVEKDAREVAISAFADNPRAIRCYESCGFVRVDQERVEGRTLVGMRLKFGERLRSPGQGMLLATGAVSGAGAIVAFGHPYPAALVPLAMVIAGAMASKVAAERRDPWSQKMRRAMLMVAIGFGAGAVTGAVLGGFTGSALAWVLLSGSATLVWIALLAIVLRFQK